MKIHYFQRYHAKENVATANTMLLLSRLYQYSSDKFFRFLKSEFFSDSFEPEIVFNLQEKSVDSIPDATITQEQMITIADRISAKDTENKEFLNGIIKYGVPIIGGALVLGAAILGVNVKGTKIPTLKS
ncbi:hypothetical protein KQ224_02285 [Streptococcus parasuis]|uniref:hypothetical protein n=1 Tax=Streptococcus parasuis TaxID=1501662 RepID=UPI001C1FC3BA|nr:hypothetical protein [Streptococcus parasuis]QWV86967.1 hypothetical protein KQ224_02285 [Streptococcus parasuis]